MNRATYAKPLTDFARTIAPGGKLASAEVALFDLIADLFVERAAGGDIKPAGRDSSPVRSPTALSDPAAFYGDLRASLFAAGIKQDQVDGIEALLIAMGAAGWPLAWAAYGLATAWHETAHTMQPVREAYWKSEDWRRRNLRYYPWYGRGYVQLTWEENYRHADAELGLEGKLIADKDMAMQPDIAATIMVRGMEAGWFAGDPKGRHTLARHLPGSPATALQFASARRIINAMDKAEKIAGEAGHFQKALQAGGWR